MDFEFSEEQAMIRATVGTLLRRKFPLWHGIIIAMSASRQTSVKNQGKWDF